MSAFPKLSKQTLQITYNEDEPNPVPGTPVNITHNKTYIDARERGLTWQMLKDMFNQLNSDNKFTDVELTGNNLDNGNVNIIENVLSKILKNAEYVCLSGNKLGPNVAMVLIHLLPSCNKLQTLLLFETSLTNEEIMSLKKACPAINIQFE